LDDSDGARHAAEYCARTFGRLPGLQVKLLHILSNLPPSLGDDGHVLQGSERQARQKLIESWKARQAQRWTELFAPTSDRLIQAGLPPDAVTSEFVPKEYDVADAILETAAAEGYGTIIIGRRGLTGAQKILLGSVSSQVVHYAKGLAVIVVDSTIKRTGQTPVGARPDIFWAG